MRRIWLPRLLTLALILYFWGIGIANLDRFPAVHEDEPWIVAPGYTFWDKGYFGTDLFAGFFGTESHYLGFPPLFSIVAGGGLHLFGMGLFQVRLTSLICIMLTLALTYRLGMVLFSRWHGLLAVAVLVSWRIAEADPPYFVGIPLADIARIARYDALVPVFALSAVLLLISALRKPSRLKFFGAGFLPGLAILCNVHGGFWLAAVIIPIVLHFRRRAIMPILTVIAGFGVAIAPWVLFALTYWSDFLGQGRNYGGRFDVLNPQFYVNNLNRAPEHYQPVIDAVTSAWGAQLWVVGLIFGVGWLLYRRDQAAKLLLVVLGSMVVLFALLLERKTFSYLATLWSFFAIIIACTWVALWRSSQEKIWRLFFGLLFISAMIAGGIATQEVQSVAQTLTPYRTLTDQIAARLPPDSRVLALQHYWLGLAERTSDYRSFLIPIYWTTPSYVAEPIPFAEAADMIPPNVVILDQHMLDFMNESSDPQSLGAQIWDYLNRARLIGDFNDKTYGRFLIYQFESS